MDQRETASGALEAELFDLLGEVALIKLVEAFGGLRLVVPTLARLTADHEIVKAIGIDAAEILCKRWSPDRIRVPLARERRARHYRASGWTNAQIARSLGITETGVDKLFARMPARPAKGQIQLDFFL